MSKTDAVNKNESSDLKDKRSLLLLRLKELALHAQEQSKREPFQRDDTLPNDPDKALKEISKRARASAKKLGIKLVEGVDWEQYDL
jgi:hypothetical protein